MQARGLLWALLRREHSRCLWEGPPVAPLHPHPSDPHSSTPCHRCHLQVLAGFGKGDVGAMSGGRGQLGGCWGSGWEAQDDPASTDAALKAL